ncbi:MAG: ASKHA domain-containing protein [Desulfobacteraceae bacterium]|nr:ASKHA domain-containing protein [Desulfobacteraceae bacterium]
MPSTESNVDKKIQGWVVETTLSTPSLKDNTADTDRLLNALKRELGLTHIRADLGLIKALPQQLREAEYAVRCVLFQEGRDRGVLVHVTACASEEILAGLAVDLGTTRVVLRLVDLARQMVLAETSFDNPQIAIGPDVLGRVHHADQPGGLDHLQELIVNGLNHHLAALCRAHGLKPQAIHLVTVAGNTTMSHLLAGLPVHWMIREPYIPAANHFGLIPAAQIGLAVHPLAQLMIFPNVGSYFGGDLIAGILYTGLHQREETAILVDVGTNAEVVLGNRDWLMACAGAAGPALEGGMSRMGAMAAPGVIDRVRIDQVTGRFELHTIEALPPRGICGSGVIDLAAQLFLAGMIDIRGKLKPKACGPRLEVIDGLAQLTIVPADQAAEGRPLRISQADLDSLVRSKAAMYTILETITMNMGLTLEELPAFLVAGTFGCFIDPRSAITIGMLPDLPLARFLPMGNTSLGGATQALLDRRAPAEAEAIRDRITYMELNVNQEFMNRFSAAKFIPHTDARRFPSVGR